VNLGRIVAGKRSGRIVGAVVLLGAAGLVQAKDYCCICQGQPSGKTISAFNQGLAVGQCSLECGDFTNVTAGKCPEPPPAAAVPAPAAAPTPPTQPAPAGTVLVYQSADCSGEPIRLTGSMSRLPASGLQSFRVESGAPASAWEKPDFSGRSSEPVAPSICVAPGFEIQAIRLR
jgi:hypothetical protein